MFSMIQQSILALSSFLAHANPKAIVKVRKQVDSPEGLLRACDYDIAQEQLASGKNFVSLISFSIPNLLDCCKSCQQSEPR